MTQGIGLDADRSSSHPPPTLRLGHELWSLRPVLHNGPGWRVPIWVQGCSIRCTTVCLNPHFLEAKGGFRYRVDEVAVRIEQLVNQAGVSIEGITVLGGEPTDQAAPVAWLFRAAKALGLSTMLYSGATLDQLRGRACVDIDQLLAATDLLIDGPFLPREFDKDLVWRGSRNQRILRISDRYHEDDVERALLAQGRSFSIVLSADGRLSVSGLQTRMGARVIERYVRVLPANSRSDSLPPPKVCHD